MEKEEKFTYVGRFTNIHNDKNEDGILDIKTNLEIYDIKQIAIFLSCQDQEIKRLTKMLYTTTKHADKLNEENNKYKKFVNKLKRYIERLYQILLNDGEQEPIAMILDRITELEKQLWKKEERYSLEEFDDIDWELAIVDKNLGRSLTFQEIEELLNQQDEQIAELQKQLEEKEKIFQV